jgi:hypothetical protein
MRAITVVSGGEEGANSLDRKVGEPSQFEVRSPGQGFAILVMAHTITEADAEGPDRKAGGKPLDLQHTILQITLISDSQFVPAL